MEYSGDYIEFTKKAIYNAVIWALDNANPVGIDLENLKDILAILDRKPVATKWMLDLPFPYKTIPGFYRAIRDIPATGKIIGKVYNGDIINVVDYVNDSRGLKWGVLEDFAGYVYMSSFVLV